MMPPLRARRVAALLIALGPFIAGPLVLSLPPSHELLADCLSRLFAFFGVIATWRVIIVALLDFYLPGLAPRAKVAPLLVLLRVGCALLCLTSLALVRVRLDLLSFYLTLATMGFFGISEGLRRRHKAFYALLTIELAYIGTSLLSFRSWMPQSSWWQALVFSSGLGLILGLPRLATIIVDTIERRLAAVAARQEKPKRKKGADSNGVPAHAPLTKATRAEKILLRAYPMVLFAAPLSIGALVYFHQLPNLYLLLFGIIPYTVGLLSDLRKSEETSVLPEHLIQRSAGITALFVLIMIFVSVLPK